MSYTLRNKRTAGPQGDVKDEQIKRKRKNLKKAKSPPVVPKCLVACKRGNIDHSLDIFNAEIQEDIESFNKNTILMLDTGKKLICSTSKNEYRIICKIGFGGFSLVWLVIDMKSMEFKVAKVFTYGSNIPDEEISILKKTQNHPNILHYYESFRVPCDKNIGCVAIYEPLGKDLLLLTNQASEYGGLSIPVIKKVAKDVLMALKTIHGLNIIHCDIKLQNIATRVSHQRMVGQLEKLLKSGKSLSSLRMTCQQNKNIDEKKIRKVFKEELEKVSKLATKTLEELKFKLIDFGNAVNKGSTEGNGTFGFRPPEFFYDAPFLYSHDIWALAVTIVELLNENEFLHFGTAKIDEQFEVIAIRNMFGRFSRRHFKDFKAFDDPSNFLNTIDLKLPEGYTKKLTTTKYDSKKVEDQIKKFLVSKLTGHNMLEEDRKNIVDFLFQMLNTVPSERKSAAELLSHPWLKEGLIFEKSRSDHYLQKINWDASKTHERKETSVIEIGTSAASSSSSLSNVLSIMSVDESPVNEQEKLEEFAGKTTEATKNVPKLTKNSFIHMDKDGKYYLFHNYWRYNWNGKSFRCTRCGGTCEFPLEVGYVDMEQVKGWHLKSRGYYCRANKARPDKKYKGPSMEEVDRIRKSIENPDEFQKEGENFDYLNGEDSSEREDDSSTDKSGEDSNKTISEFGSGVKIIRRNAEKAPRVNNNFIGEGQLIDVEWSQISSDSSE